MKDCACGEPSVDKCAGCRKPVCLNCVDDHADCAPKKKAPKPRDGATTADLAIQFHDRGPDALGRRQFTLTWTEPDGVYRKELGKDGQPVGYRRGQVFHADPTAILRGRTARELPEVSA